MVPFWMGSSYCLPVRLSVMLSVSRLVRGASSAAADGAGFTGFIVGTLRGRASAKPQCTPTAPPAGRVSARQLLAPVDCHSLHIERCCLAGRRPATGGLETISTERHRIP